LPDLARSVSCASIGLVLINFSWTGPQVVTIHHSGWEKLQGEIVGRIEIDRMVPFLKGGHIKGIFPD
jgi:hypothetical protein